MLTWPESTEPDPPDRTLDSTEAPAAAPSEMGPDTPTGLDLPGQPTSVLQVCARCHFAGAFSKRAPCPICGWDPHSHHGSPHPARTCYWISYSVWWKPWTWYNGTYKPLPIEDELIALKWNLELQIARRVRAQSVVAESEIEEAMLRRRLRELAINFGDNR